MPTVFVKLERHSGWGKNLYAKLESQSFTGSLKGRMVGTALDHLEEAESIKKGMTIVEASSGNMGIALAEAGPPRGYKIRIYGWNTTPKEKQDRINQHKGAKFVPIKVEKDREADIKTAIKYAKNRDFAFHFNQFENRFQIEAYENTLGKELHSQLAAKRLTIDVLVAGVGSGASIIGVGNYLRKLNPRLKIYAVVPNRVDTKISGLHPVHLRPPFPIWVNRPENFEKSIVHVEDEDALREAIDLKRIDNIPAGPSSGAVLAAAKSLYARGNYLLLFADGKDKYTETFEEFEATHQ
ncbi:MAG: PLP-dependent cysteine synthase family protein [Candidatus Nanoarchaeia archaeon]